MSGTAVHRPSVHSMATSDPVPLCMLHDGFACPEAQMTACRHECRTRLRCFQEHAPLVAALRHASLPKQRQGGFAIADDLAMGEGIGDEIARGWLLQQALNSVFRG